ncbi:MAG TPA: ABC transporter permease [Candidatus Angelobacter sp.]|nr:ABC transporter permease [Candidatus Angelobacter sp.]
MDWLKRLFARNRQNQEFDAELQFHIDELIRENLAAGMTPDEARRRALVEFGGKTQHRAAVDEVHRIPLLETFFSNLRFALRMLRRAPGLAAAVVVTLALGVGANTAVFSAIDAVLLRPLPFPHGDQLMLLRQYDRKLKGTSEFVAPVRLNDWYRMNSTFQSITGYYSEDISETSGALPEKITTAWVAPHFFEVWGVPPALGRTFSAEELKFGGPVAAVISDRLWRRRFNADPRVLGQKLHYGKFGATIVGVMPASFLFSDRTVDIWQTVPTDSPYSQSRESTWYTVVGRLKPGVSLEQARSDIALVQSQLEVQFPATDASLSVNISPLKEITVSRSRQSLWILFAGVTLLLLIACSNIAGLLLARSTQRAQEISIRFALGAKRKAVVAQLLTEVFLLALLGSLAGLALSGVVEGVFRSMARDLPRVDEISINWRIVIYSLGCSVATTFFCGIFPALRSTHSNTAAFLAHGGRTQVSTRGSLHWALAGTQIAQAVTLLISAGLLVRSMRELGRVMPGFDPSHVLNLHISASWGETVDMKGLTQRIDRTLDALRATPGVEAAATSATLPGVTPDRPAELKVLEGDLDPSHKMVVDNRFVSEGYFSTLQIPILEGEACKNTAGPTGIVVNRSLADSYFSSQPAIGHHLQSTAFPSFPQTGVIRGIAADVREQGINAEPMPTVYWCISAPLPDPNYLIRTRAEPMAMADTLRHVINRMEPTRSVFDVTALDDLLSNSLAENRLRTILLTLFAVIAVCMASIGLYATLAYLVGVRHREVGLRLALGAQRWQIGARFLSQGMRVCLLGCIFGLAFAAASARVLAGLLYGVSPYDLSTIAAVVALVLIVAASAMLIPALRAARTDPMEALRES